MKTPLGSFAITQERFGDILDDAAWAEILADPEHKIRGALAERVWRRAEMQGPAPEALDLMVPKSQVLKVLRDVKRKEKMQRRARRAK